MSNYVCWYFEDPLPNFDHSPVGSKYGSAKAHLGADYSIREVNLTLRLNQVEDMAIRQVRSDYTGRKSSSPLTLDWN